MSFFGFNTELPRDRGHPVNAPGFGQAPDPFASISRNRAGQSVEDDDEDDDAVDFEDTYDGLGDQLDETDDVLNSETFGGTGNGAPTTQKSVGRDFDFFGQTAKVSDAISEEQARFARRQPPPKSVVAAAAASPPKQTARPARTGYEKYKEPSFIPDLQVNASLWGVAPKKSAPTDARQDAQQSSSSKTPAKKMMSLEEVEAAMRNQSKKSVTPTPAGDQSQTQQQYRRIGGPPPASNPEHQTLQQRQYEQPYSGQGLQQHPSHNTAPYFSGISDSSVPSQIDPSRFGAQQDSHTQQRQQNASHQPSPQPIQILQNPNRLSQPTPPTTVAQSSQKAGGKPSSRHVPGGSFSQMPLVTHPEQLLQLSDEQRNAYLIEDAKRAKRNHKIHLLSKDNGLMTPQDKNFITRIQLQQLVTATGNPNDRGTDAALAEDFYYQVHTQIRGGSRQNPHQPLNNFAQTYLFQTGGRPGFAGRRQNRGGDNHMQRMEQQVQRAVEAAKLKPKNKQLIIEGSLGKISFSNAKTPKPLLNIKRAESGQDTRRPQSVHGGEKKGRTALVNDRKHILRNVELVYELLMQMEDSERNSAPVTAESEQEDIQRHMEWTRQMSELNKTLWEKLGVMAPIDANSPVIHPFIAFLSFPKGKKAIPRIFRHLDSEQRLFVITVIFVHLGQINAISHAQIQPDQTQLPLVVREEVELFSQAVIPSLFSYINEAPLNVVCGLFGLLMNGINVQALALTKIGIMILTTMTSRAELLKQAGDAKDEDCEQWLVMYKRLFDALEPILAHIFPGSIHSGEDVYVWQFLAAMAIGGSPEQQQRLVLGVRDRVLETVQQAKTLPAEVSAQRLSNVNLFMRALGLDVDKLG